MAPMNTRRAAVMRLLASTSAMSASSRNWSRSTGLSGAALMSMYSRISLTRLFFSSAMTFSCYPFSWTLFGGFVAGLTHGDDLVELGHQAVHGGLVLHDGFQLLAEFLVVHQVGF